MPEQSKLSGNRPMVNTTARFMRNAAAFAGIFALASTAFAQTSQSGQPDAAQWGFMAGALTVQKPYRGYDRDNIAFPYVYYESSRFSVQFPQVDYKFEPVGDFSFRLRARYAISDGYDSDDSAVFSGMAERKASVWLGAAANWNSDILNVTTELVGATAQSKGAKFTLGANRNFSVGRFWITPRVAAIVADKKFVNYYYGVRSDEAAAGRPAYDGKSTTNVEAGLRVAYAISPKQNLFLDISGTRLGSGIKASPLFGRSSQNSAMVGYMHRF